MKKDYNFGYTKVNSKQKTKLVQNVFSSVAPRYDIMNDLMSLGMHRLWKKRFVETVDLKENEIVLDVGSGSGDIASEILKESNIHCSIISMHTIKPFDKKTFIEFSKNSKAILTVEEHSIFGGLGECCASLIAQNNINVKLKILGIPDEYMINGSQADVLDHYDMSPEKIAKISKDLLNK